MRYRTRLDRLERRWRPADPSPGFQLLVVSPDEWPAADRIAFDAGDQAARDALVERHTGQRLGPRTRLLVIRRRPDGLS